MTHTDAKPGMFVQHIHSHKVWIVEQVDPDGQGFLREPHQGRYLRLYVDQWVDKWTNYIPVAPPPTPEEILAATLEALV